ncbi:MYB-like transcription factor ETC3 [Quercus suber]|uniref:MYB-like transcription factor ETC3 n=1 Tax=Quercus suber TaxID=58331 RepID=UPI000D2D03DB|nr:myb-like transcription factor etc1 [Quercus suber]
MASLDHSTSTDTDDTTTTTLDSKEGKNKETELQFSYDEETLVIRMFNLVGERWSLIAGRIPGRTAEEIEKYWNSRYSTSE